MNWSACSTAIPVNLPFTAFRRRCRQLLHRITRENKAKLGASPNNDPISHLLSMTDDHGDRCDTFSVLWWGWTRKTNAPPNRGILMLTGSGTTEALLHVDNREEDYMAARRSCSSYTQQPGARDKSYGGAATGHTVAPHASPVICSGLSRRGGLYGSWKKL
ncbi:uncharacterized protein LOC124664345 [Lolium rigidum]|uniref:uncharacterized protein LOC124664345 n=1 Tax=Lolium rigidum TaxID=89674 RepID=UPI001F5D33AE|nr:uncharacterized protein LOC124664345 [Lolium rigidum]